MDILTYLWRSGMVLFTFTVLYLLFMRKDAHYNLYRTFFIIGIFATAFLPIIEIPYSVVVDQSSISNLYTEITPQDVTSTINSVSESKPEVGLRDVLTGLYFLGVFIFLMRLIIAIIHIGRLISVGDSVFKEGQMFIINPDVQEPFTFYRWVLLPNDKYLEYDSKHVLVHENIHRYQHHWVDLLLAEALVVLQWFNPFTWMYRKMVKQNLEFIADRGVLDQGYSLDKYIQSIICITMGAEVSVLANHFRYSPNKRRLKMMKNARKSKWRQLKLLLMLPLLGGFLWAFSKPVYNVNSNQRHIESSYVQDEGNHYLLKGHVGALDTINVYNEKEGVFQSKVIEGLLPGTSVLIKGTTKGAITDMNGTFELEVSKGDEICFSFVGFKTKTIKVDGTNNIAVYLEQSIYELDSSKKYSKPKNEVSKRSADDDEVVFYIVEEMPSYPKGNNAFFDELKKLAKQEKKKDKTLSGKVKVKFIVNTKGDLEELKAVGDVTKKEAKLAVDLVASLGKWNPGKQRGKPVRCYITVPVEFE